MAENKEPKEEKVEKVETVQKVKKEEKTENKVNTEKENKKVETKTEIPKTDETKNIENKVEKEIEKEVEKEVKEENKPKEKETIGKKEVTNKKFEPIKNEPTKRVTQTKKKNNQNRILLVVLVFLIVAAVVGVIWTTANTPKKAVESMLYAIKSSDFEKAKKYVDITNLTNIPGIGQDNEKVELDKIYFESLKWKVGKIIESNDNSAKIEVEVTNKNFKTVYTNYFQKVIMSAFTGSNMSDEETKKYLKEQFETVETVKTTQTISLTKQDKQWKVVSNANLINAIYPGLNDAISTISNVFDVK